jgi:hypothetical protein
VDFVNFSITGGWYYLALTLDHPAAQKHRGVKMRGAVILPLATVAGGRKNATSQKLRCAVARSIAKMWCQVMNIYRLKAKIL